MDVSSLVCPRCGGDVEVMRCSFHRGFGVYPHLTNGFAGKAAVRMVCFKCGTCRVDVHEKIWCLPLLHESECVT